MCSVSEYDVHNFNRHCRRREHRYITCCAIRKTYGSSLRNATQSVASSQLDPVHEGHMVEKPQKVSGIHVLRTAHDAHVGTFVHISMCKCVREL